VKKLAKNKNKVTCELKVKGMDCATCASKIEKGLSSLKGVETATVSLAAEKTTVVYDAKRISPDDLKNRIEELGYKVILPKAQPGETERELEKEEARTRLIALGRLAFVSLLGFLSWLKFLNQYIPFDLALLGIFIGGLPIFRQGYASLKARDITVETFMSIAILAATVIGEFLAALTIVFFMLIADLLEETTIARARSAIKELIKLTPSTARVLAGEQEIEMPIEKLKSGDLVIVRPGEKIPVDGLILEGHGSVNQSPITGESMPVEKTSGDHVFAGSINEVGVLKIEAHKIGPETTLSNIINLVEKAEATKAPVQRIADRFSAYFTPIVLSLSLITWLITGNILYAIAIIVVACPCSIALATPLSVIASSGRAARAGIIVKGGRYLEALAGIDTVVMDKTGTITLGQPVVTDIRGFGCHQNQEILTYAAATEIFSEHALAKAIIQKAREEGIVIPKPKNFKVIPGKGVRAEVNGEIIVMGSKELMKDEEIMVSQEALNYLNELEKSAKTTMLIAHDGEVCGVIAVADLIRKSTLEAIQELKRMGIKRLIMLTGDNQKTAEAVAKEIGINEFYAELLPEDKVAKVKALKKEGCRIAMIGDGINDAPVLAAADIGIAMAAAGTDIAIEAADIALMRDDWQQVPEAVKIGKRTFTTIKQNLGIGLFFNIVGVSLAASGLLTPIMAAIAHVIPDIGVFLNSSKLLAYKSRSS
jgi:Cd2+/Zn2+-exporting ATPase/Cu+-exporting ATPase